jgi:nucleoid DNA-binding protein
VANKSKFSAVDVERVLDALSQVVLEEVLLSGRIVRIPRLGQFKERVYRKKNKETQESDVVIGKRSISFHASSRLSTTKNEKKGIRGKKL